MEDLKGWISTKDRLPEKSYTLDFLLIVRNSDEYMNCLCPYRIMMGTWSRFCKVGDAFDCWDKSNINGMEYTVARPIPMERVLYWRPLPEVPDDIKNKIWQ